MLKLLPKSEIQKRKAQEQRQTVDEGVKLAKRIETLRETASIEEQNLEQLRTKMVERLHTETREAQKVLDTVVAQVYEARAQRDEALVPLDAEWAKVRAESERISQIEAGLTVKEAEIQSIESEAVSALHSAGATLARAETKEGKAREVLEEATRARENAKRAEEETTLALNKAHSVLKTAEANTEEEMRKLSLREKNISDKEAQIEKERAELLIKQRQVDDMRATLESELKRLNK